MSDFDDFLEDHRDRWGNGVPIREFHKVYVEAMRTLGVPHFSEKDFVAHLRARERERGDIWIERDREGVKVHGFSDESTAVRRDRWRQWERLRAIVADAKTRGPDAVEKTLLAYYAERDGVDEATWVERHADVRVERLHALQEEFTIARHANPDWVPPKPEPKPEPAPVEPEEVRLAREVAEAEREAEFARRAAERVRQRELDIERAMKVGPY